MARVESLSLSELNELLPRIQATIESLRQLAGDHQRQTHTGARTAGRQAVGRPRDRGQAADVRDRILKVLSTTKKAKVSAITKRVGVPVEAVRYNLKVLRDERKVAMSGNRATAEWFRR